MLGHRVELAEIEAVIRQISGIQGVVALGWPITQSGADGIEVFLEIRHFDTVTLATNLRKKLPLYMVPRHIHLLDRFPLNANGKYDRKKLQTTLENNVEQFQAERQGAIDPTDPQVLGTNCS